MGGNNVMSGYYRNPEATAEAFRSGWFHSGDLAVQHPDGYIQLLDRAKDVIISGGENISSMELERTIMEHPAVLEVSVIGVPDEKWGETPKAFVVPRPGGRGHRRGDHRVHPRAHRPLQVPQLRRVRRASQDGHGQGPETRAPEARSGAAGSGPERVKKTGTLLPRRPYHRVRYRNA